MLKINDKIFMNLQEAVQWLLDNNALPFQSSANYVANTEIGLGTIVNPSPAKVRIGSLIFFADSKVSTVTGLTENGFIVSDQYNDLVDDVVYVSNVALNASGHLIVTLSNGDSIDAGIVKQVSGFSIDGSQHLIVNYNDGTSTDLGAIFAGNIYINGTLSVNGDTAIAGKLTVQQKITGNDGADIAGAVSVNGAVTATGTVTAPNVSVGDTLTVTNKAKILENITDADGKNRFIEGNGSYASIAGLTVSYCKWSLSGTHLMLVLAGSVASGATLPAYTELAGFGIPSWVYDKIFPVWSIYLQKVQVTFVASDWSEQTLNCIVAKDGNRMQFLTLSTALTLTDDRNFRMAFDLLIDNA